MDLNVEELKRQLERYQLIFDGSGLGSWDWWLKTNDVSFDRRWCKMLGLNLEETPQTLSTWETRVHPDDITSAYEDINNYLDGKKHLYESIHRMRHEKGHWVWILDRGRISERDELGNAVRFTGTHFDITEYMERDILSREIQKIANIGGWELDVQSSKKHWTEQTYAIHKVPPGTPTEALMGISFYAPLDKERIKIAVQHCIEGTRFQSIFAFIDAEGTHKWVEVSGEPIRSAAGDVIKLRGTFQDVTETRNFDSSFLDQQKRLERLMKNSPGMVYQFRMLPDGKMFFDYVSEKAFEIYEVSPQSFADNPAIMLDMVAPDARESLALAISKSAQSLTPFAWDGPIIAKSGKEKWIHAQSIPHLQTDKSIIWDGIVMNVSDKKELEEKLNLERSKALQQSKLASLGEMSAGIAHEINNPLAIIAGGISLLNNLRENPEKFLSILERVEKAAFRIEKIINGLKKFSRSSHESTHHTESLKMIIEEAFFLMDSKAKKNSVEITLTVEEGLTILCDSVEIEQVLINLIGNSIDAAKNQTEKWVKLIGFKQAQCVVLQIVDSGRGIPLSIEYKIFQPFFTTKPVGEGTGLGLSISKGILDQHKASIAINRDFTNTCFEIRFPEVVAVSRQPQ